MSRIIRANEIDFTKVTFSAAKIQENGGRTIYINHGGEKLFVQLPAMSCPYGLSVWKADKNAPPSPTDKIQLDLSLKGYDGESPSIKDFFDTMHKLDDHIVEAGLANCMQWLKRKVTSKEVIAAIFTPMLKFSKDKETGEITNKYPPVVRLNIPRRDGKVTCDVFDQNRNKLDFDAIDFKGANVTAIVQIGSVWVAGGKFGVTLKLQQMKVVQRPRLSGYAFIADSDDDADGIDE